MGSDIELPQRNDMVKGRVNIEQRRNSLRTDGCSFMGLHTFISMIIGCLFAPLLLGLTKMLRDVGMIALNEPLHVP